MTDLELMQLLEDDGYEATAENLIILKEGIESGELYISSDSSDDEYDMNMLKEALVELSEDASTFGVSLFEGLEEEDFDCLKYLYENVSITLTESKSFENGLFIINEAAKRVTKAMEAQRGADAVTSSAAQNARAQDARSSVYAKAAGYDQKAADSRVAAKKAWNMGSAAKNFFGRLGARISGNKEKLTKLQSERTAGKLQKANHLADAAKNANYAAKYRAQAEKTVGAIKKDGENKVASTVANADANIAKKQAASISSTTSRIARKHNTNPDGTVKRMSGRQMQAAAKEITDAETRLKAKHANDPTASAKAAQTQQQIKTGQINVQKLKESYSDYELYQILESSGYTTTEANLAILKEGLETGKYYID